MDRCFAALVDALTPWGGDVVFFGGDALFVAFTGEDHAAHAVEAARAMREALRAMGPVETPLGAVRLRMSMGAASGSVTAVVGEGPQRPWFLAGETVSRTGRLEAAAGPGEIRVDELTA